MSSEKRRVTLINLSIIIEGNWSKEEFDVILAPKIRQACLRLGVKYAPEVWLVHLETKEMEIIPK